MKKLLLVLVLAGCRDNSVRSIENNGVIFNRTHFKRIEVDGLDCVVGIGLAYGRIRGLTCDWSHDANGSEVRSPE